jgi:hypothetical protein
MNNPAEIHYKVLKDVMKYLAATPDEGIHYWRSQPHPTLPMKPLPTTHHDNYVIQEKRGTNSKQLIGYVDSDWATNTAKRSSMTGMVIMYAGGAVGYKSKFQSVIARSSTEAEFVAACDMAKMILFYRSLLADLEQEQTDATVLFEDNNGALLMANVQQPTKCTRHMDIKHFAILDWVEQDMLILETIHTSENVSDAMTKTLNRNLFYRHYDTYMGLRVPDYCDTKLIEQPEHSTPNTISHTPHRVLQTPATVRSMGGGTRHTYM